MSDMIEEAAYGNYYEKNGKQYIIYKTEETKENSSVSSMIKLDGNEITIKRSGGVNSTMVYRAGEKRSFLYEIPYGKIEMETETERIVSNLTHDGGTIELLYTLTVQGEKYFNDMKITIVKR